jgi:hypothetical protein
MWHAQLVALTPEQREALDELVPREQQTGDVLEDTVRAFRQLQHWRNRSTVLGPIIITAAHEEARRRRKGWDLVAETFGEPRTTLRRWGDQRPTTDEDPS